MISRLNQDSSLRSGKPDGRIKEADYILCHHTPGEYQGVAREMDALLELAASPLRSVQCRAGRMKLCTGKKQDAGI